MDSVGNQVSFHCCNERWFIDFLKKLEDVRYIELFLCHVNTSQFLNYLLDFIFITFLGFMAKWEIRLCSYYRVSTQVDRILSEALFVSMRFSNKGLEMILRLSCYFSLIFEEGEKSQTELNY